VLSDGRMVGAPEPLPVSGTPPGIYFFE
jgi:hypothetical protein